MFGVLLVSGYLRKYGWWNGRDDLKFGVVADNGISLISVSWERRMVNVLNIDSKVEVWVPGGLSWYQSDKVKRLLIQENKQNKVSELFFYNFGLKPDKIFWLESKDDWDKVNNLWWKIGPINGFQLKSKEKIMLVKEETINKDLKDNSGLEETLFRDFSDNKITEEQIRVTLVNASEMSGLATWLALRMEWAGMSVMGLETSEKLLKECQIVYSSEEVRLTKSYELIKNIGKCSEMFSKDLGGVEVQMLIGSDLAEMINYSSYK